MSEPENLRAFPSAAIDERFGGMTLRDYFAGKALTGALVGSYTGGTMTPNLAKAIAVECFQVADAMLAERVKGGDA